MSCFLKMEGVGFTTVRKRIGIPFVIPPLIPPLLFVSVTTLPFLYRNASFASDPLIFAKSKPMPNSIPFTAGIEKTACASIPSTVSNQGSPMPSGSPITAVSKIPPTLSPSAAARSISSRMASADFSSSTGKRTPASFLISSIAAFPSKCLSQTP